MPPSPAAPPTPWRLFLTASRIGVSGFGGVLPLIRHALVEELRVIDAAEFNALLGLCQLLPGSNVVNLAVCVGARLHGKRGALAFAAGLLCLPFLGMMAAATAYGVWGQLPVVQDALRGVAAAGAGLLFATAWKMSRAVHEKRIYLPFAALILFGLIALRLPLPPLLLALLLLATLIARRRLP